MAGVLYAARAELPARWMQRTLVGSAAAAQVLTFWNTIRRYTVGLNGSLTFQHAAWTPLLNPWLLLVINTGAMTWLAGLALSPPAHPTPSASAHRPTAVLGADADTKKLLLGVGDD